LVWLIAVASKVLTTIKEGDKAHAETRFLGRNKTDDSEKYQKVMHTIPHLSRVSEV